MQNRQRSLEVIDITTDNECLLLLLVSYTNETNNAPFYGCALQGICTWFLISISAKCLDAFVSEI